MLKSVTMPWRLPARLAVESSWKRYLLPFLLGGGVVASAVIGAALSGGDTNTGGINGFVLSLSGSSEGTLNDLGRLVPFGFAFAVGLAAAVNPCGFAMLPAYLGLYLGSDQSQTARVNPLVQVPRALMVGGVVTSGFVLLFGLAGLIIGGVSRSVGDFIPWLGLGMGVLLTFVGAWLISGGKIYTGMAARAANRIGDPREVSVKGYFLFGLSYGTASLSCTLTPFLLVVGTSLAIADLPSALAQGTLFALGMGSVIIALTVGMALFKATMVGALRKALPLIQPVSSLLMLSAGGYIVFYWLTIGSS